MNRLEYLDKFMGEVIEAPVGNKIKFNLSYSDYKQTIFGLILIQNSKEFKKQFPEHADLLLQAECLLTAHSIEKYSFKGEE